MELNAEQIKKALECCEQDPKDCPSCPLTRDYSPCSTTMAKNALALINELTEKEKMSDRVFSDLYKEAETYLAQRECLRNQVKNLTEENERLHASCTELARKMQDNVRAENEELRKSSECDVRKLEANIVRKILEFAHYESCRLGSSPAVVDVEKLDQKAKEMVEGEK